MIELPKTWGAKKIFFLIFVFLIATDIVILLNIPFLRQLFGFLFLTILPGVLILQIFKLNKIGSTEKFVLSVGLSISVLMFFGLFINNLSLSVGYKTPLATITLLISFNIAFIVLAIIGYKLNKDENPIFSLSKPNLSSSEKAFLTVPILFPALSIFGMHVMNTTDNNIILMFMLFLIPAYIAFVCVFNQKFSKRFYPVVIFLISISLLLMLALRSDHIIGRDTHQEYYFFQTTLNNLYWSAFGHSTLDACLAISLLPTIYQSILNVSPEFLFKILYSLLFSISPLVIYVLSKKHVGELYGFLASCFFMSQINFLFTELQARTNTAILFFALAMMILFSDKVDPLKKRILFLIFMASCMVSHYSTTYIFFFVMVGTFIGIEILSKKYTFKKVISLTITILFFAMIFFWYSQVTEAAFNSGVRFVGDTFSSLNEFFIVESRGGIIHTMFGEGIEQKGIPHKIEFVWTWLMFAFIGIGIITIIRKYKEMSFPELNFKKPEFLKEKFTVEYFMIALICTGLLVVTLAVPYIAMGYNMDRMYFVAATILSIFFVIGGITLSKHFFFFRKRKPVLKEKNNCFFGRAFFSKERFDRGNGSQVRAYLIILLVLIPYFLSVTGVTYQMFGYQRAITLNSEGRQYDLYYVHDQGSYGAKWLKSHFDEKTKIHVDFYSTDKIMSQGGIRHNVDGYSLLEKDKKIGGYIYLRYTGVVDGKLMDEYYQWHNVTEYQDKFTGKGKIYANGGSEIYL